MGYLTHKATTIAFDDRILHHLQHVITNELRTKPCLPLTWKSPTHRTGLATLWLDDSHPIHFTFHTPETEALNPAWISELTASAQSSRGLLVTPEPAPHHQTI